METWKKHGFGIIKKDEVGYYFGFWENDKICMKSMEEIPEGLKQDIPHSFFHYGKISYFLTDEVSEYYQYKEIKSGENEDEESRFKKKRLDDARRHLLNIYERYRNSIINKKSDFETTINKLYERAAETAAETYGNENLIPCPPITVDPVMNTKYDCDLKIEDKKIWEKEREKIFEYNKREHEERQKQERAKRIQEEEKRIQEEEKRIQEEKRRQEELVKRRQDEEKNNEDNIKSFIDLNKDKFLPSSDIIINEDKVLKETNPNNPLTTEEKINRKITEISINYKTTLNQYKQALSIIINGTKVQTLIKRKVDLIQNAWSLLRNLKDVLEKYDNDLTWVNEHIRLLTSLDNYINSITGKYRILSGGKKTYKRKIKHRNHTKKSKIKIAKHTRVYKKCNKLKLRHTQN